MFDGQGKKFLLRLPVRKKYLISFDGERRCFRHTRFVEKCRYVNRIDNRCYITYVIYQMRDRAECEIEAFGGYLSNERLGQVNILGNGLKRRASILVSDRQQALHNICYLSNAGQGGMRDCGVWGIFLKREARTGEHTGKRFGMSSINFGQ